VIVAGPNTQLTGTGNPEDPYEITAGTTQVKVTDTASVDLTLGGDGASTPYNLSAAVRLNPSGSNLITSTASGLLVACADVQDCVAEAMGPGLTFDTADRLFEVQLSEQAGNTLLFGPDGGLYNSVDGSVVPSQPRARIGKSTGQAIVSSTNTVTTVAFDQVFTDNAGMFGAIGRLTAQVEGGYTVGTTIQWQSNGNHFGHRAVFLRLNGSQFIAAEQIDASKAFSTIQNISTCIDLDPGDYVEVLVQQSQGVVWNLLASTNFVPTFWMYLTAEGA